VFLGEPQVSRVDVASSEPSPLAVGGYAHRAGLAVNYFAAPTTSGRDAAQRRVNRETAKRAARQGRFGFATHCRCRCRRLLPLSARMDRCGMPCGVTRCVGTAAGAAAACRGDRIAAVHHAGDRRIGVRRVTITKIVDSRNYATSLLASARMASATSARCR
jgi:hypothetical protein